MLKNLKTLVAGLVVPLTCAALTHAAPFTFTEDFESVAPGELLPTGWVETDPANDFDVSVPFFTGSNAATLASDNVLTTFARASYEGQSAEGIDSTEWLDYDISVQLGTGNWSDSTSSWWGMATRTQADGSFLGFRIRGTGGPSIQLIHVNTTGGITTLQSSESTSTIDSAEIVDVTYSIANNDINQEIVMSVEMITQNGANPQTRTASVALPYTDALAIVDPGPLMLVANDNASGSRQFHWDDIAITGTTASVQLEGDLNGDGFVGLDDLDIILNAWNQTVPPGNDAADPSGDGFVGLDDLDLVLNNWNAGTPSAAAVPEPTSLMLLGFGALLTLRRR